MEPKFIILCCLGQPPGMKATAVTVLNYDNNVELIGQDCDE